MSYFLESKKWKCSLTPADLEGWLNTDNKNELKEREEIERKNLAEYGKLGTLIRESVPRPPYTSVNDGNSAVDSNFTNSNNKEEATNNVRWFLYRCFAIVFFCEF